MKLTLAAIMLFSVSGIAMAQTAPSNGKGLTEAQARYDADVAGYAPASNLTQDKDGNWMGGNATKGNFIVDKNGKVSSR